MFRAFTKQSFTLLWSGQTISSIGDFLYEVTLAWWVLQQTGSALAMGTVLICVLAPLVLFSLIGGVAVDRLPRVPVMLLSDLVRGVVVTGVAILGFAGLLEVWHILVASLVFGTVDAFFRPAYAALVPEVVPEDDLPSANALTSLSIQIGRIAGPALGATVIALVGTTGAFVFNAVSFFISALCLLPLLRESRQPVRGEDQTSSLLHDAREGFQTVLRSPVLWITILISAISNITLAGPYSIAMPFLVKERLGGDVSLLGLLYASFPVGYILGGFLMGRLTRIRRRGLLTYVGLLTAGLMLMTFGFALPVIVLVIAALINGAALEIEGQVWTNILQDVVPSERLGRVSSIDSLGSFALLPLGYALTGWATDLVGPATIFVVGGGLTALFALLALLHPTVRAFD